MTQYYDAVTYIADKAAFLVELEAAANAGVMNTYFDEEGAPKVGLNKINAPHGYFENDVNGTLHTISLVRVTQEQLDAISGFSTVEILNSVEAGQDPWAAVHADPVKQAKLDLAYPRPLMQAYDDEGNELEGQFWQRPESPGVFA